MTTLPRIHRAGLAAALVASTALTLAAQQPAPHAPAALTADDYRRAERLLNYNTTPLVLRTGVRPTWLDDGRFWYQVTGADGREAIVVDPGKGTKAPCDLPACKAAVTPLPPRAPRPQAEQRGGAIGVNEIVSPDGARVAFVRDHNMWVRELKSGRETQLTKDGVEHYAYGTNNAGWTKSDRPILAWSPDSRKILTFQHDGRNVGTMALATTTTGHPVHQVWKYPLPGDEHIFTIERVVLDVAAASVVRFKMPPDPHRGTLCDHIVCRGGDWSDVQWSEDARQIAFVSSSRDHREARLRIADAATGAIREVLEEKVDAFYESGNGRVNWRVLFGSNEVIWFSQRDDWGHLYLYDLANGKLKHQITTGEGNVTQLLRIDEKNRELYFLGMGRETGRDPYYTHFYRIGMDGKNAELLTPENANHEIALAPSGDYFVDVHSTPQTPPVAVLRRADGTMVLELEKADVSRLLATGWKPPISFTVKGRDGKTDLYGLMFRPTNFDETKKYPIVNSIYPGPQSGSVGSRSFTASRGDRDALAELGFIVVSIDGMGTPGRSKPFHETYYNDMGDNTLPDQVTGMEQLAKRHPWIDLERAGIYGHSGGGYATAGAMFRYPDFFKVGVSQAGNHDNRAYEDDWAEKWMDLLVKKPDGSSNYDDQANQTHAHNLKGKLLLAHGTMDANVPPYNTYLVVDALIRANKDFDLIMFPNRGHGFGSEPYMIRRRWDYFVKHLMGAEPPREFELTPPRAGGS
jgi:dipeptidyl-peptidase 4